MTGRRLSLLSIASMAGLWLALTRPTVAQPMPGDRPEKVDVEDLVRTPGQYDGRIVMVEGRLESGDMVDVQNDIYELRGESSIERVRVGEPRYSMRNLRFLQGQEVRIIGVFWNLATMIDAEYYLRDYPGAIRPPNAMTITSRADLFLAVDDVVPIEGPEPTSKPAPEPDLNEPDIELPESDVLDLRDLVDEPEPHLGKLVSVIGKFRGDNLYQDLSIHSKKTPRDFVIKVADKAIWVTGKRPRGKDFELNPERRRDTGKWLKIAGEPWTSDGMVYLKARKIEMVPKPDDPELEPIEAPVDVAEDVEPEPPPEVVFSMPLDGEVSIPLDTEFRVQFSKDMSEGSFDRNIDLLYADDDGKGNPFPDMQVAYDPPSRSLVVVPGKSLAPGKEIRLILYKGIMDEDGQTLASDPDAQAEVPDAAVILEFSTEQGG